MFIRKSGYKLTQISYSCHKNT